jgi:hypothetical protein
VLLVSSAFTWSGVSDGRSCRSSAAAPETNAAACEVPLPRKNRPPNAAVDPYFWSMNEPGTRSPCTEVPGATRSGLRTPSPRVEKAGMVSSEWVFVPLESLAPTARTYGSCAGLSSLPVPVPSLPAETTTTMPLRQAISAA